VLSGLAIARGREAQAPLMVRLGFCAGRIKGSLRHRVLYL
jgi:hypothetical protein